jgi:cobalamin synthase
MQLARELGVAAAFATGRARRAETSPRHERVAALAWLPLAGLAVGALAVGAAALAAAVGDGPVAALAAVVVLRAADGGASRWGRAVVVGAVEALALVTLGASARTVALLVAPMLARWACVVQCHGGMPAGGATGLAALAGRARFREFAIASVTALGVMLVLLDAVGLVVAVVSALVTLLVRVVAYRRRQGLDGEAMNATSALVETSALVVLASISAVFGQLKT